MATTLPAIGTCSYNGYTIPVESETIGLTATPVQDSAKRTIVYVVYSITMQWKVSVAAGSTTDTTMDTIRRQLTAQGGAFRYEDKGLGNISVNVGAAGSNKKDVVWGPVPKILKLKPSGVNCVDIIWQIDVAIPECSNASFAGQIMEFNYKLTFDIQTNGYQIRNYSGFIRIPMTRQVQSSRSIPDNIDAYREKIVPAFVNGFRRKPGTFTIDESKTRLDFSIDDEEVGPTFPPPGCVSASASQEYRTSETANFVKYISTIKAEYEIVRGANPYVSLNAFIDLVNNRIEWAKFSYPSGTAFDPKFNAVNLAIQLAKNALEPGLQAVIPLHFSASEPDIYGPPKANFSFSYMLAFSARTLLTAGLWRPVPGSNWRLWTRPLSINAWGAFGNANLIFRTGQDAIVDLCVNEPVLEPAPAKNQTITCTGLPEGIKIDKPTPENSFLLYENSLRIETVSTNVIQRPLGKKKPTETKLKNNPGFSGIGTKAISPDAAMSWDGPPTIIQQRSPPIIYIIMEGRAARVGYEIEEPALTNIGLVPTFRVDLPGDGFSQGIIGNVGLPIYAAKWRIRYAIPNSPTSTVSPPVVPQNFNNKMQVGTPKK